MYDGSLTDDQARFLQEGLSFSQRCRDVMFEKRDAFICAITKWSEEGILRPFDSLDEEDMLNLCLYVGLGDDVIAQLFGVDKNVVTSKRSSLGVPEHTSSTNGERTMAWLHQPKIYVTDDLKKMITTVL